MKSVLQFIKMLWMALYMGVTMGIIIPVTFSIALPFGLLNLVIDKNGLNFISV
ncbi:hypothetical protein [Halobacteriovorax sp. HLS]|uniref:hypothetical protein n=1 Tax=Halobacteriovorax sp. HLS TaxID=2234000 RepID=UPI0013E3E030|nr:hypothetical protein [Halobacteriovorax sp. HLS]